MWMNIPESSFKLCLVPGFLASQAQTVVGEVAGGGGGLGIGRMGEGFFRVFFLKFCRINGYC